MDYPFTTAKLDNETIDNFYQTYTLLKEKFHIETTGKIDFPLADFEVFKHHQKLRIINSYAIKNAGFNCYILYVEACYQSTTSKGVSYHTEYQTWALAYLKKDFGRIMIRSETLLDKLLELVHPIELDFEEDKAFSDTFYVLVNDHQKAVSAMDRNFRNVVMDIRHRDFVIEIINHTLIIGHRKPISPENAGYLAEFVSRVCSLC
jgi:hypothetical protein